MGQGLFPKEQSPLGNFTVGPIKCQSTLFGGLGNLEKEKTSRLFSPWDSLGKNLQRINGVINRHVISAHLQN